MAEDPATSAPKPSWHEREIAQALQRLASARAQLASLEEQVAAGAGVVEPDPADLARVAELQAEIDKLTAKASGRFGASSARAKLADAERQLRLVLDRLGVDDVADLRADAPGAAPAVDPTALEFAQRECAQAEQAFLEVAAMVIPDVEPESDEPDAEVLGAESFGDDDAELDLRIEPSAAS